MMKKDCIFRYITWNYIEELCALSIKWEFQIKLGIACMVCSALECFDDQSLL